MMKTQIKSVSFLMMLFLSATAVFAQMNTNDEAANHAEEGKRALAQGHFAVAQADFEKLAKLEPGVAEVHATLAAIYFQQREYEGAIREIRLAQKLKPSLPKLDSLLGLSLAETGQYALALPGLEKGFKQSADPEIRRMCGLQLLRVYPAVQRDSEAVETALALNRYYPDDPEVLYHTGRIYGNQAYVVMTKLHDKAPNSIWMLQAQGEANESQKNYDAALVSFKNVLELDPRRPGVHYRMGRIHLSRLKELGKIEDQEAAANEFESELKVDPDNGNARYELGVIADRDGKLDVARQQFEQVLLRYPEFEEALVALGGCYLEMSKPTDALPPLERAARLRPDDEVAWYRLSRAQRANGETDAANKSMATFRKIHDPNQTGQQGPNSRAEVTSQKLDADAAFKSRSQ
jgi:tetratricopeptide (TPR) repeat protein